MSEFQIRRQEPEDAIALHELYSQPRVLWGTTLMPYPSLHFWKTKVAEEPKGMTRLVACIEDRAVGHIVLSTLLTTGWTCGELSFKYSLIMNGLANFTNAADLKLKGP